MSMQKKKKKVGISKVCTKQLIAWVRQTILLLLAKIKQKKDMNVII